MGGGEDNETVTEAWDAMFQHFGALLGSLPERLQLYHKMEYGKKFALEHPMVTLFLVVSVALGSVPLVCFVAFACGSLFLTFVGFVFVEGFLLTVGGVIFGVIMCMMGLLSLGLSLFLILAWMAFSGASRLLTQARDHIHEAGTSKLDPSTVQPSMSEDADDLKDLGEEKAE